MEREAKNYASSKTIRCYVCNTVGHKVKDCPSKLVGNKSKEASVSHAHPNTQQ